MGSSDSKIGMIDEELGEDLEFNNMEAEDNEDIETNSGIAETPGSTHPSSKSQ
jgi:hypothetical protein